ncbi:MAG: hypothetical protein GY791_02355 [Alphaproteobacteria bacterium]|nr:hypothetical protein [Alphaproteobacteria bacterium]
MLSEVPNLAKTVALTWVMYFAPVCVFGGIALLVGWKRVKLLATDYAIVVVPYGVWLCLLLYDDSGKTIANLIESLFLGAAAAFLVLIRIIIAASPSERSVSSAVLIVPCLIAIGIWGFAPPFAE